MFIYLLNHNFRRERRAEADSNQGPSAYQPNALLLGQTWSLSVGWLAGRVRCGKTDRWVSALVHGLVACFPSWLLTVAEFACVYTLVVYLLFLLQILARFMCACVFALLCMKMFVIFVCFVRLHTIDLYNYVHLRIVCF